jgi:hypothetical protein
MTIGASIFLIAVGAILKYAVDVTVSGLEIQTIGLILMIAGAVGLIIGLFLLANADRRRGAAYDDRPVVDDRSSASAGGRVPSQDRRRRSCAKAGSLPSGDAWAVSIVTRPPISQRPGR